MRGIGIRDGRGYGPYGTGYYCAGGRYLPLGPRGERLSADFDFRPGPNGAFVPRRLRPLRELPAPIGDLSGYDRVGDVEEAPALTETAWRHEMLTAQRDVRDWQRRWVENDRRIRYMQIAATLAIPLAAAVWKVILKRSKGESLL